MEIIKEIEFRRQLNSTSFTSFKGKIKLIKNNKRYYWVIQNPNIFWGYMIYNKIYRKTFLLKNKRAFVFSEKDLSEESIDVAYFKNKEEVGWKSRKI